MIQNHVWVSAGIALLLATGCSSPPLAQAPQTAPSPTPVKTSPAVAVSPSPSNRPVAADPTPVPMTNSHSPIAQAPVQSPSPQSPVDSTPTVVRDYDFRTPIPATGRVTQRDNILNLDPERLIADCPADSAPYAFAESTHYWIQVCSAEYDPWMPKYYIGRAKDGSGELRITGTDPNEARQLIFRNGDYSYILYRDGARPETMNAYLEVVTPGDKIYAEALFYLYERTDRPRG